MNHNKQHVSVLCGLIQVCTLNFIIAGVVMLVNLLAAKLASMGKSVLLIFIVATFLAEITAAFIIIFQLIWYSKTFDSWSKDASVNVPLLGIVGGAAAAQFASKHLAEQKPFNEIVLNSKMITEYFFYGNLVLIAICILYVGIKSRKGKAVKQLNSTRQS